MMRKWFLGLFVAVCLPLLAQGQFGSFSDIPVEITAAGETRFEGGVAIAEDHVQIHYGDVSIYADYAEYNPDTRDVLLIGNIRLYTSDKMFTGQRALYNLETKQLQALEFGGSRYPLLFRGLSIRAPSLREFRVKEAQVTTDDSSDPDFRVKAKTIRIYSNNNIVFVNSTLYVGQLPVFWFPYLFARTDNSGFELRPGYDSRWGGYLLTSYSFPFALEGNAIGTVGVDYRYKFGIGLRGDAEFHFGKDDRSWGKFRSYYAYDTDPESKADPGEPKESGDHNRYRVSFQDRLFLADDVYATFDINKLSDLDFLEDYFPNEFRVDPQPDNVVGLTKWSEFYTLTLWTRWQMNDFFETTERLPELAMDVKQHRLFGLPVFYDGENTVGEYRRAFVDGSKFPDYDAMRFDSFHQISFPKTYFGWLSIVPRVGVRGTFYNKSGRTVPTLSENQIARIRELKENASENRLRAQQTAQAISSVQGQLNAKNLTPDERSVLEKKLKNLQLAQETQLANADAKDAQADSIAQSGGNAFKLEEEGAIFRPILNAGVEASFKLSRKYEWMQLRALGLDGVLHVIQPYTNYSFVHNAGTGRDHVFQFDRVVPATEPLPIDFPQFVGIDSIDSWNIWRVGIRNRIITRRGDDNFQWLSIDQFFDVNFENPYNDNDVSNLVNRVQFSPLPWAGLTLDYQFPLTDGGFTDTNTGIYFMPYRDLLLQLSNRYLDNNPFFADSNQYTAYAFWRLNSNWAVSAQASYEAEDDLLYSQRYMIHRDLSSWIVSVGAEIREDNDRRKEYGVLFSMSLKDAPQMTLPFAIDSASNPLTGDPAP